MLNNEKQHRVYIETTIPSFYYSLRRDIEPRAMQSWTMTNYELDEIHRIRRKISAKFGHDATKLGEYYRELEKAYRKSAKYKFVDPPDAEPEAAKPEDSKVAD